MHPSQKYPELWKQKQALEEEKAAILEQSAPIREARKTLQQQIAELMAQDAELGEQIVAIERPRLVEVKNQIAALARAMGARSLKAEPEAMQR